MQTAHANWLVTSEPDAFIWEQQGANRVAPGTGLRNHMAGNNLRAMQRGDLAFFDHCNHGKETVGVARVVHEVSPDPTAESGDWVCVDMEAVGPMLRPVTLADIKATPAPADFALVRMSRLSVMPASPANRTLLCRVGECKSGAWCR